jgi:transposase-like protein
MRSHPRDSQSFPEPRKRRVLRKRGAEERERLLALFERSEQTHRQFCREHDVALSTLTFWRRQARQSARHSNTVSPSMTMPSTLGTTRNQDYQRRS